MIPKDGWKPMSTAPKDGTTIWVKFYQYNDRRQKEQIQAAQWCCESDGTGWTWRAPWRPGTIAYADSWMTYAELQAAQAREAAQPAAPAAEFDL